jgi:2-amino-4-hydroxy-6-hydroxymethyldihydropteridine diphosphokinase
VTSQADWVNAYIGLGSNLQNPQQQLLDAVNEMAIWPDVQALELSPLYRTAPIGPQDQPDFINAVARLRTCLSPSALLKALQGLEQKHGRVRQRHWGERTLDLDILLYGTMQIEQPELSVPHPQLAKRAFVILPLRDVAEAGLAIPGLGLLSELPCPDDRVERIEL